MLVVSGICMCICMHVCVHVCACVCVCCQRNKEQDTMASIQPKTLQQAIVHTIFQALGYHGNDRFRLRVDKTTEPIFCFP